MDAVRALVALVLAHILPGALLVRTLHLGRCALERWVMAAVLGGPLGAAAYLISLVAHRPSLYWLLVGLADLLVVGSLLRGRLSPRTRLMGGINPPRRDLLLVATLIATIEASYLMTTATLFRTDAGGNFLMDGAFQEETLFHVGMVRALESSYPPQLLSFSGVRAAYHVGYDLQVAAWSRFFGLDPFAGLYRVGPVWSLALLVLSAYLLGIRFGRSSGVALASACLLFGSGLGFLFASVPRAEWWSLVFMDATLVSVFLTNPLLPGLSLLFVGLLCLDDYLSLGSRRALLGSAVAFNFLLEIKLFLAVHILGAVGLAALLARGAHASRARRAALLLFLLSAPMLVGMALTSGSSNTSIGIRPLEIVRYSLVTLGHERSAGVLAAVARGEAGGRSIALAAALTALWLVGFLGVRLLGASRVARELRLRAGSLRHVLSLFVLVGFPLTLVLRIAPSEATGLSRDEALNDAFWFATNSGIVLWFWTAEALVAFGSRRGLARPLLATLGALIAFPGTVQHFVHKTSLRPDVIPRSMMDVAGAARELSNPGDVFVEPVKRVRPSVALYLAGRPVVYESYVGYNYMFVGRRDQEFRRHAVGHFFHNTDPGYTAWFLSHFNVSWIFLPADAERVPALEGWATPVFSNPAATIYRVRKDPPPGIPVAVPADLPLRPAGNVFFGEGWAQEKHLHRGRRLLPGDAALFLPLEDGLHLTLTMAIEITPCRWKARSWRRLCFSRSHAEHRYARAPAAPGPTRPQPPGIFMARRRAAADHDGRFGAMRSPQPERSAERSGVAKRARGWGPAN